MYDRSGCVHRILFRQDDKADLVAAANRIAIAGLVFLALAMCGSLLLVASTLFGAGGGSGVPSRQRPPSSAVWCGLPLRRACGSPARSATAHALRPSSHGRVFLGAQTRDRSPGGAAAAPCRSDATARRGRGERPTRVVSCAGEPRAERHARHAPAPSCRNASVMRRSQARALVACRVDRSRGAARGPRWPRRSRPRGGGPAGPRCPPGCRARRSPRREDRSSPSRRRAVEQRERASKPLPTTSTAPASARRSGCRPRRERRPNRSFRWPCCRALPAPSALDTVIRRAAPARRDDRPAAPRRRSRAPPRAARVSPVSDVLKSRMPVPSERPISGRRLAPNTSSTTSSSSRM